jgi:hypothetical protein
MDDDLLEVGGDERQRSLWRAAFHGEEPRDSVGTKRIGRQAIQRICRQRDDAACGDHLGRDLNGRRVRDEA